MSDTDVSNADQSSILNGRPLSILRDCAYSPESRRYAYFVQAIKPHPKYAIEIARSEDYNGKIQHRGSSTAPNGGGRGALHKKL